MLKDKSNDNEHKDKETWFFSIVAIISSVLLLGMASSSLSDDEDGTDKIKTVYARTDFLYTYTGVVR